MMKKKGVGPVRSLTELPSELQSDILLRLPVKSILFCKCICKSLRTIISNPNFVQSHLTRINSPQKSLILHCGIEKQLMLCTTTSKPKNVSSLSLTPLLSQIPDDTYYEVSMVGSCNGLILIAVWFCDFYNPDYLLILWNPVIKQHRNLPKPNYKTYGLHELGFIPETNDYVVLKIGQTEPVFEVYKMSTDSWITIDCSPREAVLISKTRRGVNPVFLNGSFHWDGSFFDDIDILYYNLKDDELGMMKAVDCGRVKSVTKYIGTYGTIVKGKKLAVIDQSLAMIYYHKEETFPVEIWVMNDYGVEDSWNVRFRISEKGFDCYSRYFAGYWTSGLIIINEIGEHSCREQKYSNKLVSTFLLYDVNTRSRMKIAGMDNQYTINGFCSFLETLVPVIKEDS